MAKARALDASLLDNWDHPDGHYRIISGELLDGRYAVQQQVGKGTFATVVTPIVFELADMAHNGWHFDVTAWCVAYPGGLVALVAGGVLAIGKKDTSVAAARQVQAMPPLGDKGGAD